MFPFYNQQQIPQYHSALSYNPYLMFPQQFYQLNPNFNNVPSFMQNVQLSYPAYHEMIKPLASPSEPIATQENPTQNVKYHSCNCVNTDCRKQYCICFKNGEICGSKCGCSNCRNKELNQKNLTSQKKKSVSCNCKKSECAKKYCECYANGIKCGQACHCCDCKNC